MSRTARRAAATRSPEAILDTVRPQSSNSIKGFRTWRHPLRGGWSSKGQAMDLQAAGAALGSVKAAFELSKTMVEAKSQIDRQAAVSNLQQVLIGAQQQALTAIEAQAALKREIEEMRDHIAQMERWDSDASRYELKEIAPRVFAYALRAEANNGEPPHHLCTACYGARRKGFLQSQGHPGEYGGTEVLECTSCKAKIGIPHRATRSPQVSYLLDDY